MQRTTEIQPGDTLVNDKGTVTIEIDAVDGDTVEVTDSRRFQDDGEYPRSDVEGAIEDGPFRVVRDSDLTAIKGVGTKTAPKLEATTDCETPAEIARAFLDGEIDADTLPRSDYFLDWILDNAEIVGEDPDKVRVLLFLKDQGGADRGYYDGAPKRRAGKVDTDELRLDHLSWESGAFWPDARGVIGVGTDNCLGQIGLDRDDYVAADSVEQDGDHYLTAEADGGVTHLTSELVETVERYFGVDVEDALAHPDGDFPVVFDVPDSDSLTVIIAPRIRT